jgi:hypothetical protein
VCHQISAKAQHLTRAPLRPVATATSVRVRNGRLVTDGPFAESKERSAAFT